MGYNESPRKMAFNFYIYVNGKKLSNRDGSNLIQWKRI